MAFTFFTIPQAVITFAIDGQGWSGIIRVEHGHNTASGNHICKEGGRRRLAELLESHNTASGNHICKPLLRILIFWVHLL